MVEKQTRSVASIGLVVGSIFGMIGSFVDSPSLRGITWGIDGIALILATALLTIHFFRKGEDVVAAGFLIFVIGEGLIVSCSAIDLNKDISSFAAGVGLWATSLLVLSSQKVFPIPVRVVGAIAAILFAIVSVQIFTGEPVNPLTKPLPFYAYPLFVMTIFGWVWTLLKKRA